MNTAILSQYEDSLTGVPLIGHITWYTVNETSIGAAAFDILAAQAGLPSIGKPPADADVWRRCCSALDQRKISADPADPASGRNLIIRNLIDDSFSIVRRIIVEVVDPSGKRLSYTEMVDVIFDRASSTCKIEPVAQSYEYGFDEAWGLAREVRDAFHAAKGTIDSNGLRRYITRQLTSVGATAVRPSGGVYYVPVDHKRTLDALGEVVSALKTASIHNLPLIDSPAQREMVKEAFVTETNAEAVTLLREIASLHGETSKRRVDSLTTRYVELTNRVKTYTFILEDSLDSTHSTMELLRGKLINLSVNE